MSAGTKVVPELVTVQTVEYELKHKYENRKASKNFFIILFLEFDFGLFGILMETDFHSLYQISENIIGRL